MYSNPLLSGTLPDSLGSLSQLVHLYMHSSPSLSAHAQQPFAEWHRTRQPRKSLSQLQRLASASFLQELPRNPRSACAPRHAQQPFAEWHHTRQTCTATLC
eukprot:TRINITY_DN2008_c0_g1_i115.p1 TRINITY_DN2008_c0_g1~~TRINITY_DN2008_c0_g1_i115.p1  ORF type:complete len:101 (+),score=8.95 TRINITY_DN2008_c0_g1_i115:585-887(+)